MICPFRSPVLIDRRGIVTYNKQNDGAYPSDLTCRPDQRSERLVGSFFIYVESVKIKK